MRLLSPFWVQKKIFVTNPFFYTSSWFLKGNLYTIVTEEYSQTATSISSAYAPSNCVSACWNIDDLYTLYTFSLPNYLLYIPLLIYASHILRTIYLRLTSTNSTVNFPKNFVKEIPNTLSCITYRILAASTNYFPQAPIVLFNQSHM